MRGRTVVFCVLALAAAGAARADDTALPDGMYVSGPCQKGPVDGSVAQIGTGDFYGKGKDRFITFDGGFACKISKLKRVGDVLSGTAACESRGAGDRMPLDPMALSITLKGPKAFSVSVKDPSLSDYPGKTWTWCR